MAKLYNNILETVGNTPVVRINKLAPTHVDLYVKLEAFNPMASVKDRLAVGVIEAAEKDGSLKAGQTVVEATSGNTMKPELETNIKRRPDGSIDTAHYMRIGRQMRSEQAHQFLGKLSFSLSPARLQISKKYIRSVFLSPCEKLQGV